MIVVFALSLLYLACVVFYEAHAKRASFAVVKGSVQNQRRLKAVGWGLAVVSLFLFAAPQGWERGIPIWLGVFTLVGGASLLVAALAPKRHVASGVVSGAIAVVSGLAWLIGALL